MIRQIFKLAIEAALFELRAARAHLRAPAPKPAPPPAEPQPKSPWQDGAYHMDVLGSTKCPGCGAAKAVGWYWCPKCVEEKCGAQRRAS